MRGQTLYVTDSSCTLVKVTLAPSATVSREAPTSLAGLQTGETVVVRGTATGGSVTASSIIATPASPAPAAPAG